MDQLINGDGANELFEAFGHVLRHTGDFMKSMILKCAVQLGIPDIIHSHGQPMTLQELVAALPIHPSKAQYVSRLMRVLLHLGFFSLQKGENDNQECYSLTRTSCLLLKDSPMSVRPLLLMVLDPVAVKPWDCLTSWFQNDDTSPFSVAHGKTLYEYASQDSRFNSLFNHAMAADSLIACNALLSKCKGAFQGLESMVDVAGGTGTLAKVIAETFPQLKCTVFDLPHVVANLQGSENLNYIGGNMFESIPSADSILLKCILHNWGDEECVKILKLCREAIKRADKKEGKVMIIDVVMEEKEKEDKTTTESQLLMDMQMMVLVSAGRQRNEKEWAKLFFDSGFTNYKITLVLGPRALIEVYP